MSKVAFSTYADIINDKAALHNWKENLISDPYRSYLYAYPHKTSYREFETKLPLSTLWSSEPADTFFLYMHIPFCGARCGFCNLFTLPDKSAKVHEVYVDALERQAKQWAPIMKHKPIARFAIGGGTPTLLEPVQLERLFRIAEETMGLDPSVASISVETSPETVTAQRLQILKERRVDRVSMGIQSFVESEATAIYRPQKPLEVERALEQLKLYAFPILNLDLIYGLPGQTIDSWLYSLDRAISYEPEEIFLYPLYTREQTIVKPEVIKQQGTDHRMSFYLAARERLLSKGYVQYSMRRFAKLEAGTSKVLLPYGCQEEGMIGLGCGARSYTQGVHYASRYGVSRNATASIIADYVETDDYTTADYGIILTDSEQKRRFILKAILHMEGLALSSYSDRFGTQMLDDHPELKLLLSTDLAWLDANLFRLSVEGMAHSDAIGDWFISSDVRDRMEGYVYV
ncbi:coproporphyrinogen III oxidase [Paenibacillus baekrokdamisoli]|uniref:Heme chaperone HemW n=1 Tax=Paenibacillus baekrokdamisoli TaxID=1712516 RepID=A0A3G9JBE6_9BACL|nr:STM4012 family radical SAM protein [Paenibacillus baekrokdamisoli]MBB3072027.1 oxygen-independent coproporphyrinogen-3 oxidase [Paenibacillus baekrokdamisoli]BBH20329.1 coproporphyrinogen III oxidase [Paenibacillus baekrokdamisoli]